MSQLIVCLSVDSVVQTSLVHVNQEEILSDRIHLFIHIVLCVLSIVDFLPVDFLLRE